jgi:hypothetical protein
VVVLLTKVSRFLDGKDPKSCFDIEVGIRVGVIAEQNGSLSTHRAHGDATDVATAL